MRDLELLRSEMGVLWDLDTRGRICEPIDLAVGIVAGAITAAVGRHVPDEIAADLLDIAVRGRAPRPDEPPGFLRELLTADLGLSGGPSYYIQPPVRFANNARLIRSDNTNANNILNMRPDNWRPDEWIELINGGTGAPWAMVLDGNRVVSICHTSRLKPAGAEAGTWTDPEFRGRGYAAATTATWADILARRCPRLFYSTSADNYSSQHVAERLGLRPIGWIWKLTPAGPPRDRVRAKPRRGGE